MAKKEETVPVTGQRRKILSLSLFLFHSQVTRGKAFIDMQLKIPFNECNEN